ncbi:MAG: polyprenyl synthetase family protein [Bacillota bacterium]
MIFSELTALPELQEVDQVICESVRTPAAALQEMMDHLFSKGGKKLRPLLVFLAAGLLTQKRSPHKHESLLKSAAAVELIHTASLVHDDIIDGAAQRRGNQTLHCRWDDHTATLAGDFLLSRAFNLICSLEQRDKLLPLLARSVALMCQGETRQMSKSFDWNISEQEYLRCNYLKTSQFLAVCCEVGGQIMPALPYQLRALREYGFNLGQAFQIVDDILDYTEQPQKLGKPIGSDLNHGLITLPLIYLLRRKKRYRGMLRPVLSRRSSLFPVIEEQLHRAVKASDVLQEASRKAGRCMEKAQAALQAFPPGPARGMLDRLAETIISPISAIAG